MGDSDWFFKFMRELGTNGVWASLSKAAKALYPMLGIHTDGSFKPVYPSIPTLMKLAGLSKKGVEDGLRDLEHKGLIVRRSGKSRRNGVANRSNIYEFTFEYPGSTLAYLVGKGLTTGQESPSATQETTPSRLSRIEQELIERDQKQQQQPIHVNITLQQDERIAAAALELLRKYFDENAAQRLVSKYPPAYIREKIELVERRSQRKQLRNKSGYLRRALEDGWQLTEPEREGERFGELVGAIQGGKVREGRIGGISWRAGITGDGRAIFVTHMTSGAQMRLESWEDCRDIEWR